MTSSIAILGAPSSIGIKPYDDATIRRLDLAPGALREQGLVARLGARDLGDVLPPPYLDVVRPAGRPRNEAGVAKYSRTLAGRVAEARREGAFTLVLGGDCSIVLGCLLGLRASGISRLGLVYIDAHADFATPESSRTGSAASMCLALAVGRGDTPLARLDGDRPLVRPDDVVLIGRSDGDGERWYGEDALAVLPILDLRRSGLRKRGAVRTAEVALERVSMPKLDGFWIHLDADVLEATIMPAVDSPEAGGLTLEELSALLDPLVRHPRALGLEVTIYDPGLDPDQTSAGRLAGLLEQVLTSDPRR